MLAYFVAYEDEEGMHNIALDLEHPPRVIGDVRYMEREIHRRTGGRRPVVLYFQLLSGAAQATFQVLPGDGQRFRSRAPRS